MGRSFITLTLILLISELSIVMIQSADSGGNQNHPPTPHPRKVSMEKLLGLKRSKEAKSHQDKLIIKKGRPPGSVFLKETSIREPEVETNPETGRSSVKSWYGWTNEECEELLRLMYTNCAKKKAMAEVFDWKNIMHEWNRNRRVTSRTELTSQRDRMRKRMRKFMKSSEEFEEWPQDVNDDLLKIYFSTEYGEKSKHGERIYAKWVQKHPENANLNPEYLLNRAETMVNSVMKFDLDNPQGPYKKGQSIAWKEHHDDYLLHLWNIYSGEKGYKKQYIYNEAVKKYQAMGFLTHQQVYDRTRKLSMPTGKSSKLKDMAHVHDDFTSLSLGTPAYHGEKASSSSQQRSRYNQQTPCVHPFILESSDINPDTNLYLGNSFYGKSRN